MSTAGSVNRRRSSVGSATSNTIADDNKKVTESQLTNDFGDVNEDKGVDRRTSVASNTGRRSSINNLAKDRRSSLNARRSSQGSSNIDLPRSSRPSLSTGTSETTAITAPASASSPAVAASRRRSSVKQYQTPTSRRTSTKSVTEEQAVEKQSPLKDASEPKVESNESVVKEKFVDDDAYESIGNDESQDAVVTSSIQTASSPKTQSRRTSTVSNGKAVSVEFGKNENPIMNETDEQVAYATPEKVKEVRRSSVRSSVSASSDLKEASPKSKSSKEGANKQSNAEADVTAETVEVTTTESKTETTVESQETATKAGPDTETFPRASEGNIMISDVDLPPAVTQPKEVAAAPEVESTKDTPITPFPKRSSISKKTPQQNKVDGEKDVNLLEDTDQRPTPLKSQANRVEQTEKESIQREEEPDTTSIVKSNTSRDQESVIAQPPATEPELQDDTPKAAPNQATTTGISSPSSVASKQRSPSISYQTKAEAKQAPPSAIPMPISPGPRRPAPASPERETVEDSTLTPASAARRERNRSDQQLDSSQNPEASLASYYTPIPGVHTQPQPKSPSKAIHGLRPNDPLYAEAEAEMREAQLRREAQEAVRQRQLEYDRLTRVVNKSPRRRAMDLKDMESGTDDEANSGRREIRADGELAPLVGDLYPSPRKPNGESDVPVSAVQAALEHRRKMRQMRREVQDRENRQRQFSPRQTDEAGERAPTLLPPISQLASSLIEGKRAEAQQRRDEYQQRRAAEKERERQLAESAQKAVQQRLQSEKPTFLRMEERYKNELEVERQRMAQVLEERRHQIENNRFRRDLSPALQRQAPNDDEEASGDEGSKRHRSYITKSLAMVRNEEAQRHMEKQVAQEQLRNRLLLAREYAANVPLPATDVRKTEEMERVRQRNAAAVRQAEDRRRRGEEALRNAKAQGAIPRRNQSVPVARAIAPPRESKPTPSAGHSAYYRDYLKEIRAQRGERTESKKIKSNDPEREQAAQMAKELGDEADRLDLEAVQVEKNLAQAIEEVKSARSANTTNDEILEAQKKVDALRTQSIRAKIDALKARQAAEDAMPDEDEE